MIRLRLRGLTEHESRALNERRRLERSRPERADEREHAKRLEESWQQGGFNRRHSTLGYQSPVQFEMADRE